MPSHLEEIESHVVDGCISYLIKFKFADGRTFSFQKKHPNGEPMHLPKDCTVRRTKLVGNQKLAYIRIDMKLGNLIIYDKLYNVIARTCDIETEVVRHQMACDIQIPEGFEIVRIFESTFDMDLEREGPRFLEWFGDKVTKKYNVKINKMTFACIE